jgi:membrane protein
VLLLVFMLILAVLYAAAPNVKARGFRWVSPGAALAVVVWLVASGLFALYVANFGSYNKTYGALASVIIFLVWLWISNLAILLGVELDAELEHERAIHAGVPADAEPFAVPKDTRKIDDDDTRRIDETVRVREAADRADAADRDRRSE